MSIGTNETTTLSNSLPTVVASARQVREQEGTMPQLVDKETLAEGTGLSWREVAFSRLPDATSVSEGDDFDQPTLLSDSLLTATPVEVGIEVIVTDRVKKRLDRKALKQTGSLAGNAMQRKKAKDGITQLDSFSTSFGGTGSTFAAGYVHAAVAQIEGNATERGIRPIYTVVHRYLIRDIEADLAPVGTYPLPDGISGSIVRNGFSGTLSGSEVFADSVKAPDGSSDHKGGTFAKQSIVLVQGYDLYTEEQRLAARRATAMFMFDEYIYVERFDTGGVELYFNATAPTS